MLYSVDGIIPEGITKQGGLIREAVDMQRVENEMSKRKPADGESGGNPGEKK